MDNMNINRESIRMKKLMNELFAEQAIDADITLPEYYQDIVRILKCSIYPVINSVAVAGEHVTADGVAYLKIVYAGECQNVYCYEMSYPFSKSIDINGLGDDCKVLTTTRVESCNCRAVTSRRIDIHAAVKVCFRVVRLKEVDTVKDINGKGVQLQKKESNMLSTVNVCEKAFLVEEAVDLPDNQPGVLRVLRCEANPLVSDVKVISNKLMLKGESLVNILYIPEDGTPEILHARFAVPFNEILEVPGIEENHICDVNLLANSVDAEVQSKGGGEGRTLALTLRMTANVNANEIKPMTMSTDSYSTDYEVNIEKSKVDSVRYFEQVEENYICKGVVDLSDVTPENILDVSVVSMNHSSNLEDQKVVLKGNLMLAVLYSTGDGNVGYREKGMNIYYEKQCPEKAKKVLFDPSLSVVAVNHKYADNNMDVKVELLLKGSLFLLQEENVITDINVLEDTKREKEPGGLIIYYADKNERLWDIARKYNISSEMLKTENKVETDVLEASCTLLIPCI